ncbi:MAG: Holliday junction resolvase RuvX [Chloroflexota bacterium]
MSRLLGIDLGDRRIGLAIAEPGLEPARPLSTLARATNVAGDAARLATVIRDQRITELVIGLPINADGSEGPMAEAARTWATAIGGSVGLPVHLRDERLSSHLAEDRLGPMPRGRSGGAPTRMQRERYRAQVDRAAAAIILQDELDARASSRAGDQA